MLENFEELFRMTQFTKKTHIYDHIKNDKPEVDVGDILELFGWKITQTN